jgi:DNA-binding NtrC family response regulator
MIHKGTLLRILVVDDEPLILWAISRFLGKSAIVKTVSTAEEAIDEIGEQHYDLCFLDNILPGMTGFEAMKIINERSPDTKVAIMSGSVMDDAMKEQIEDLAYAFIEKPFELSCISGVAERATIALNLQ